MANAERKSSPAAVSRARRRSNGAAPVPTTDRHVLYEAAVQGVGYELDFFRRVFRSLRGRPFRLLREDFCGTAALAGSWARRSPLNRAWGVDLDQPTLEWARSHRLPRFGKAQDRVTLIHADVRRVTRPRVEVVSALNYSYWVFKRRADLLDYFRAVHRSLFDDGLLILDLFGGEGAACVLEEHSRVKGAVDAFGRTVPPFTYIWEHKRYNPVNGHLLAHIHFEKLPGGRSIRRAFTYDWRLWTVPELRDVLAEAGFSASHIYLQGWDKATDEPQADCRRRVHFDNENAWLAYIVAER